MNTENLYDTNGHLKQVIRVKCDNIPTRLIVYNNVITKLRSLGISIVEEKYATIDLLNITIVFSLIDGYDVKDLLTMLDKRYAK